MIVKVQLSIITSEKNRRVLIYNEDRTIEYETDASKEIVDLMRGDLKAFFHASMVETEISLNQRAEWQEW